MNQPSYYEVLGIEKTASQEDVKKAYRESVKKYHPDANEVANASLIFRMVQEAYEVLSDENKRRAYDMSFMPKQAHEMDLEVPKDEPIAEPKPTHQKRNKVSYTFRAQNPIITVIKKILLIPYWAVKIVGKILSLPILVFLLIAMPLFLIAGPIVGGLAMILMIPFSIAIVWGYWTLFTRGYFWSLSTETVNPAYISSYEYETLTSAQIWILTHVYTFLNWIGPGGLAALIVTGTYLGALFISIFLISASDLWVTMFAKLSGYVFKNWEIPNVLR